MSLTPDPDPTAAGGANTDPDEGHQPAVNPPEQVDVRRWNDALFQWGRRNGPLVAGLGVATLALVFVGMRLAGARRRRSWDQSGTGLFQSGTGLLQRVLRRLTGSLPPGRAWSAARPRTAT
jgi:hypothetical protein